MTWFIQTSGPTRQQERKLTEKLHSYIQYSYIRARRGEEHNTHDDVLTDRHTTSNMFEILFTYAKSLLIGNHAYTSLWKRSRLSENNTLFDQRLRITRSLPRLPSRLYQTLLLYVVSSPIERLYHLELIRAYLCLTLKSVSDVKTCSNWGEDLPPL